ncbi:MAG: hypothetical protein WC783_00055 [Candidatus Paceibacterota bacterium]|jgi:DNA-directed RNA polymerase subunit RPC12/RpoP
MNIQCEDCGSEVFVHLKMYAKKDAIYLINEPDKYFIERMPIREIKCTGCGRVYKDMPAVAVAYFDFPGIFTLKDYDETN